ncbi:hypothetical protein BD410DRAFT_842909 [Rickenella mellea]|uniref:Uncharacterized protein n=1 Tax=Rickenella mellea TaxID=50990 RepID=A0A4Y7PUM0_9AGAM|nr:hypothetical protein BD410DRAFT_842909 [Rickenella mellea]
MEQNYPSNIQSILDKHPALAVVPMPVLGDILNLNARVDAGQPLDRQNVKMAEQTAKLLENLGGKYCRPCVRLPPLTLITPLSARHDGLTEEVIETARNRAIVIRNTHAGVEFNNLGPPAILLLQQIQQQITAMDAKLTATNATVAAMDATLTATNATVAATNAAVATTNAAVANFRIISRNARILAPTLYTPPQKSIPGDGRDLAQAVLPAGMQLPPQDGVAAVGEVPAVFNGNPSSYTHWELIHMIIFYNELFHIVAGDDVATRRNKFREWLSVL